jgi:hypothetical protein
MKILADVWFALGWLMPLVGLTAGAIAVQAFQGSMSYLVLFAGLVAGFLVGLPLLALRDAIRLVIYEENTRRGRQGVG